MWYKIVCSVKSPLYDQHTHSIFRCSIHIILQPILHNIFKMCLKSIKHVLLLFRSSKILMLMLSALKMHHSAKLEDCSNLHHRYSSHLRKNGNLDFWNFCSSHFGWTSCNNSATGVQVWAWVMLQHCFYPCYHRSLIAWPQTPADRHMFDTEKKKIFRI